MSLEETIAANTAAIGKLTEVMLGKSTPIQTSFTFIDPASPAGSPTKAQTIAKVAGDVAATAVGLTGAAPLAADAGQIVTVTVQDVLALASKLIAKTDKATLQDTLKDFDLKGKKLSDITPEYLKPAYDKLTAALAACQQA